MAQVIAIARRGRRLVTAGVWIAGVALTGGLWFLRNLVEVGSPLPQVMSGGWSRITLVRCV